MQDYDAVWAAAKSDEDRRWGQKAPASRAPVQVRRTAAPRRIDGQGWSRVTTPSGDVRVKSDRVGGFVLGAIDTLTFGYLDEISAWGDTNILRNGRSYEQNLRRNRAVVAEVQRRNPNAHFTGQVGGAFVPVGGAAVVGNGLRWGKAALRAGASMRTARAAAAAQNVARSAAVGAAQGAVYGAGSAEGDMSHDLEGQVLGEKSPGWFGEGSRLRGAAEGGAWGAVGGLAVHGVIAGGRAYFARGKNIRLKTPEPHRNPIDVREPVAAAPKAPLAHEAPEVLPSAKPRTTEPHVAPKSPAEPRPNTRQVPEDGAVVTPEELMGDPAAARAAINKRLGALSADDAVKIAARLDKAEAAGEIIDDPHYRSLLNVNLEGKDIDPQRVLQAVELLDDTTSAIQEKAGAASRSMGSMDRQVREAVAGGVIDEDLAKAVERSRQGIADVRIASHTMSLAGVQFARAKDRLLPAVRAGTEGAREELTDALTKAAQLYSMGKAIVGNTGRALRSLQGEMPLQVDDVADRVIDLDDPKLIRERVEGALKELNDDDLAALVDKIKDQSDVGRIGELLQNAEDAKAFSWWNRTQQTASTWLRSNALSPATGVFNSISAVMHDFFRNDLARNRAAKALMQHGLLDEAAAMRLEVKVARSVYWAAHQRGIAAMLNRIKWEALSDVERIAGVGFGSGKVVKAAKSARAKMAAQGYSPPVLREFDAKPTITVADHQAFQARLAQAEIEGGAFAKLWANTQRVAAVAGNTVDAAGQASMKLFTGAVDDWGRTFVRIKETYAQSARFAVKEGAELGLVGDDLTEFVMARSKELAEMPNSEIMGRVEETLLRGEDLPEELRFFGQRDAAVDLEADRTLFMDGPQTSFGRTSAKFAAGADRLVGLGIVQGVLLPYIRTPIRLFERGMVSYTPWGKASDEVRAILAKGGPEAAIVKAQMELGTQAIGLGMLAGLTGTLVLTNGEFGNTRGLDEGPPNRLQIGSAYVEIGRLDPFALSMAIGGMLGQAIKEGFEDGTEYDVETGINTGLQIAFLAAKDAILSKSYLTGLRDMTDVLLGRDADNATAKAEKVLAGVTQRLIPVAGTSRLTNDTIRDSAPDAMTWTDQMLRAIPGAGIFLPVKRDILGDPVDSREFGVAIGLSDRTAGKPVDDVVTRLRDLEITLQDLRRADPSGFGLSADQLNELRRLRGHEAVNSEGLTLREALRALMDDPSFEELPEKDQKRAAVADVIREFNKPARDLLEEKSPQYRSNRTAYKAFEDYINDGMSREDAETESREDVIGEGLPEPDL